MAFLDKFREKSSKPVTRSRPVLATLDARDLRLFTEQRKTIGEQGRLLAMLQVCYNSTLAELKAKYKISGDIDVNTVNGEVHRAATEKSDG